MKIQAYNTIHKWVQYNFKKSGSCTNCGTSGLVGKKIHWANVSGEYKRDRSDWVELCAHCHQEFDGRYKQGEPMYAECIGCGELYRIYVSWLGEKVYCNPVCRKEYNVVKETV